MDDGPDYGYSPNDDREDDDCSCPGELSRKTGVEFLAEEDELWVQVECSRCGRVDYS